MGRSARLSALILALLLSAAAVVTARTSASAADDASASVEAGSPNILFVLTDDMTLGDLRFMPRTRRLIGEQGTTFDNYFVTDSVCCPSRTTILRGQYPHNTGVLTNGGPNGGFETAYRLGVEQDTFATRLQRAGYRTAFLGKYLNHYPRGAGDRYVPPGWDYWVSAVKGHPYTEYGYTLNANGTTEFHGSEPRDYGTDVYMRRAAQFIRRAGTRDQPFLLSVGVYAPHLPATPAPADRTRFAHARAPRTPAFDLADVSAKPEFIRSLPPFTPEEIAAIDRVRRTRLQSLQAVDRGVAELVATLEDTGQLAHTYVVFSSDNGFHLGQQRLPAGKRTAYDTDIRVPLLVRGPGVPAGRHVRRLALNTDLAPTFTKLAGTRPPSHPDGRSLLPLLGDDVHDDLPWRRAFLVEHWNEAPPSADEAPPDDDAGGIEEPPDPDQAAPDQADPDQAAPGEERNLLAATLEHVALRDQLVLQHALPEYTAVRTSRYLYVEYATGERELYDLKKDPDEIHNLAGFADTALEARLARRLARLRTCRGQECRASENLDVT